MRLPTRQLRRSNHRLSVRPELPRKGKGLPGHWAVLFVRAVMKHSAGLDHSSPLLLFEKIHGQVVIAFTKNRMLDFRNEHSF